MTIEIDEAIERYTSNAEMCSLIEQLPSVKPQTGHWVKGKCDQCGGHAPFWSMATTYYESEYCPKCGAKMVDESEDKE